MKVWITRYALTEGIFQTDVDEPSDNGLVRELTAWPRYFHTEGKDWHQTLESAQAKAEEMRKRKIISMRKALKKLEELSFNAPGGQGG